MIKNDAKFEGKLTSHFKIDIRNLTNFDPNTQISKIFSLVGSFWAKYILFELKRYKGVIFHETEEGYKIWRGIYLLFQNWHKEFDKFWPEHSKVSKIFTLMGSFWAEYILFELKTYRELSFMKLKRDKKFGEESTCRFKIDTRNLTNFYQSTRKCQTLMGSFCPQKKINELKTYSGVMCHENEEWYKNWRGTDLSF